MITIKKKAIEHFFNHQPENKNLYLNLKKTGCSGYSYQLEWIENIPNNEKNQSIEIKNPKNNSILYLFFSKEHFEKLDGLIIDFEKNGLSKIVTFNNPNTTGTCGCGISVSF